MLNLNFICNDVLLSPLNESKNFIYGVAFFVEYPLSYG